MTVKDYRNKSFNEISTSIIILGTIAIILTSYALSEFMRSNFSFWSFMALLFGIFLFPKQRLRTYIENEEYYREFRRKEEDDEDLK